LVFALVMVVALLASTSAPAQGGVVKLSPVGDEPNASGVVHVKGKYTFDTSVSCQGLTPGATYWASAVWVEWDPFRGYYWQAAPLGGFVADKRGAGGCRGMYQQTTPYSSASFHVDRYVAPGVTQRVLSSR